jgi:hypothetical protein
MSLRYAIDRVTLAEAPNLVDAWNAKLVKAQNRNSVQQSVAR